MKKTKQISLATLRGTRGLTQKEFAHEINVSAGLVGLWETGKRNPSLNKAMAISKYFDTPIEAIAFGKESNCVEDGKYLRHDTKTEHNRQCDGQISLFNGKNAEESNE